jgi:hypothetical protein
MENAKKTQKNYFFVYFRYSTVLCSNTLDGRGGGNKNQLAK